MERINANMHDPCTTYAEDGESIYDVCNKVLGKVNEIVNTVNELTEIVNYNNEIVTEMAETVAPIRRDLTALMEEYDNLYDHVIETDTAIFESIGMANDRITNLENNTDERIENIDNVLVDIENEHGDPINIDEFTTTNIMTEYSVEVGCKFPTMTIQAPSSMSSTPFSFFCIYSINGEETAISCEIPRNAGGGYPPKFSIGFADCGGYKMPIISYCGKVFAESEDYVSSQSFIGTPVPRNTIIENFGFECTKDFPIGTYVKVEGSLK